MSSHFNQLNPAEAERLAILAEECAEVIQVIGKILRHGYESCHPDGGVTNRRLLEIELGHVDCAYHMMHKAKDLSEEAIHKSRDRKKESVTKYLHHQTQ